MHLSITSHELGLINQIHQELDELCKESMAATAQIDKTPEGAELDALFNKVEGISKVIQQRSKQIELIMAQAKRR